MFVSKSYPDDTSLLPDDQGPVKLLSVDGEGIRGLTALLLLQKIVEQTNHLRERHGLARQEHWEMFDMIGGTGTGG